jgi:hypothetical protein
MSSAQEANASTAEAFEAFGQQFLVQFAPLPPNRKRKAKGPVGGPPKKRRKEQSPTPEKEISFEHSDKGSGSLTRGSEDSSENGVYLGGWHRDYTESFYQARAAKVVKKKIRMMCLTFPSSYLTRTRFKKRHPNREMASW